MARLIHHLKLIDAAGGIEERVIWTVPKSDRCPDGIRYRLAYVRRGETKPEVLYDNHHPKGHHRHVRDQERPYGFSGVEQLLADFGRDVEELRWKH
jgi:hypothetical protein